MSPISQNTTSSSSFLPINLTTFAPAISTSVSYHGAPPKRTMKPALSTDDCTSVAPTQQPWDTSTLAAINTMSPIPKNTASAYNEVPASPSVSVPTENTGASQPVAPQNHTSGSARPMNGTSAADSKATFKQAGYMSNIAIVIVLFLILGLTAAVILALIWMLSFMKDTLAVEDRETI